MGMNIYEQFRNLFPYMKIVCDNEVSMAIADTEQYLYVDYCDELDFDLKGGSKIPEGGAVKEVLVSGKTIIKEVPEHVYGIPFKSYAIPIKHEGNVIGVFVVGKSLKKKKKVLNISKDLAESLSQISQGVSEIAKNVQELAVMNEKLASESRNTTRDAAGSSEVVKVIQGISAQTNLLGLNASIEAARAGENGRGFTIVAQEIRKLSNSSNESIKQVDEIIKNIINSISSMNGKIERSNELSQNQSASLEEISASIYELNSTAGLLEKLADDL